MHHPPYSRFLIASTWAALRRLRFSARRPRLSALVSPRLRSVSLVPRHRLPQMVSTSPRGVFRSTGRVSVALVEVFRSRQRTHGLRCRFFPQTPPPRKNPSSRKHTL